MYSQSLADEVRLNRSKWEELVGTEYHMEDLPAARRGAHSAGSAHPAPPPLSPSEPPPPPPAAVAVAGPVKRGAADDATDPLLVPPGRPGATAPSKLVSAVCTVL